MSDLTATIRTAMDEAEGRANTWADDSDHPGANDAGKHLLGHIATDRKLLDLHWPYVNERRTVQVAQCDHCMDLCHSGSGLACDSPDAPWPCPTVVLVAATYGIDATTGGAL